MNQVVSIVVSAYTGPSPDEQVDEEYRSILNREERTLSPEEQELVSRAGLFGEVCLVFWDPDYNILFSDDLYGTGKRLVCQAAKETWQETLPYLRAMLTVEFA